jgi:hypothetical protein
VKRKIPILELTTDHLTFAWNAGLWDEAQQEGLIA